MAHLFGLNSGVGFPETETEEQVGVWGGNSLVRSVDSRFVSKE